MGGGRGQRCPVCVTPFMDDPIDFVFLTFLLQISSEIVFDVEAIKECCDEAIVAFGGKPISGSGSGSDPHKSRRPDEAVGLSQDLFHSPPRVEMAFKQVLKNMTVGENT
jgi:hypothetical protein